MMKNGLQEKLDRCFADLGVQEDDLLSIAGWFCVAQWVIRFMNGRLLPKDEFKQQTLAKELRNSLRQSELLTFPISERTDALYELVLMVLEAGYTKGKAKMFFSDYLPCVVADRSYFVKTDTDRFGGAIQCTLVYLAMLYAGDGMGCNAVHELQAECVFETHKENLIELGVSCFDFSSTWEAVHSLSLQGRKEKRTKIKDAMNVYKSYKIPPQILLEHYVRINSIGVNNLKNSFNPWEDVHMRMGSMCPERGITLEEKIFNDTALGISREYPTDVVHTLFYEKRNDASVEIMLARMEIKKLLPKSRQVLVVNPSPAFLEAYVSIDDEIGGIRETVFAVTDDTVRKAYSFQFQEPRRFITISDLEKQEAEFDYVVILARDYDTALLWTAVSLCKNEGNLTFFIPQTSWTNKEDPFVAILRREKVSISWIMDIPSCYCQSRPKKKAIVSARKSSCGINNWINLIFNVGTESRQWLVPEKKLIRVPMDMLSRGLTLLQMRRLILDNGNFPKPRECGEYNFSREIKIAYNFIYSKQGLLEKARAYYRNIHRPEQANRQKGTRPNNVRTERGLRGKTSEEILRNMEKVALYDEFYDCIVDDILDFYKEDFSIVTLKTLWFCCRKALCSCVTYNEDDAIDLFCGENQRLSELRLRDCTPEKVNEVIEGEDSTKLWRLLHLIFKMAVEQKLADKNPFSSILTVVKEENRKRLYALNSSLKKSHFTQTEEAKMVAWLMDGTSVPPGRNADSESAYLNQKSENAVVLPRCVVESKWLIGAFSLFGGLPLREICPLCWGDIHEIGDTGEMQIYITKHLNTADQIVSNLFYAQQQHYRKVPLDRVLVQMLSARKRFLMDNYGFTDEALERMPIILDKEPIGRGRKKFEMITRNNARIVKKQLLEIAQIPNDVINLLEGEARFDVDLNASKSDLFAANFRDKALHTCGFTDGELCHYSGNKAKGTFERHYCDYDNDFLQYNAIKKLYRWTYVYDSCGNLEKTGCAEFNAAEGCEFVADCFSAGRATGELNLTLPDQANGDIEVEIECAHGVEAVVLCRGE